MPVQILPSTGAIRKRRKKPETGRNTEAASNRVEGSEHVASLNETVRPLMAAEGRPSETRNVPNGSSQPAATLLQGQASQTKSHLLLKRPPITGATSRDENEEVTNSSTDEDLAEADQTTIEMLAAESETQQSLHTTSALPSSTSIGISIPVIDSSSLIPDEAAPNGRDEEEEEEDNLSRQVANNTGIRLSGDGEQGL